MHHDTSCLAQKNAAFVQKNAAFVAKIALWSTNRALRCEKLISWPAQACLLLL
jgi:hypothetical protein